MHLAKLPTVKLTPVIVEIPSTSIYLLHLEAVNNARNKTVQSKLALAIAMAKAKSEIDDQDWKQFLIDAKINRTNATRLIRIASYAPFLDPRFHDRLPFSLNALYKLAISINAAEFENEFSKLLASKAPGKELTFAHVNEYFSSESSSEPSGNTPEKSPTLLDELGGLDEKLQQVLEFGETEFEAVTGDELMASVLANAEKLIYRLRR